MKNIRDFVLLASTGADGNGAGVDVIHSEDTIRLLPITAGTVSLTLFIDELNPDGTTWHQVATAAYATAGAQAAIKIESFVGRQIRARIGSWVSGTIAISGYAGAYGSF